MLILERKIAQRHDFDKLQEMIRFNLTTMAFNIHFIHYRLSVIVFDVHVFVVLEYETTSVGFR